ncbi:hypothetical protein DES38_1191 [Streptohalobacillus salinus]|uniref:Uncharacterized protein n=2 Tax=Streptohalobacillus salinus TaxID=621096 RepID=A0A2V3W375_9BACI|nr:hypothetical protein DES38_1191 [Streptohalobacillus salinus]
MIMLGLMVSEAEMEELKYLVRREMEEILFDSEDPRIDERIKETLQTRYQVLFQLLKRIGTEQDVMPYLPRYNKNIVNT